MNSGNDLDPDDVMVDPHEWPRFDRPSYSARSRDWDRIGASLFVLWLVPTTIQALQLGHPAVLVLGLTVLYAASYLTVWWRAHSWPPAGRIALVCVLFGVGLGCVAVTTPAGSLSVLGYALSAAIILLPLAWSQWVGLVCVAGAALATWWHDGQVDAEATLILALIAVITLGLSRSARLVGKLHQARGEVRTLAVAGERARLARDLHDVLGHSLTTITVKTALARRLLERDAPKDRVLEEIRDTEDLSRRALADIRSTVSGQRRMSLAVELVSARAALRAAGIEADLPHAVDDVLAGLEEPLAYVLREGVTNVVRHSGAHRCTVRLGARWLEVRDDGPSPVGSGSAGAGGSPGNGLAGLTERLAAVHGTLTAGPLSTGGYRLRAEVPE
ncbi:MAG TPA: histidine kinase [Pseudonocardia sp.]|nr:histidine kinase [Pseudonocardia sp.]